MIVSEVVRGIPDGSGAMSAEVLANVLVYPTKKAAELVQSNPNEVTPIV